MTSPRIDVVTDTYFGTTVEDPYRWMEDTGSPETQAWIAEQATLARNTLDALPERHALFARIMELADTVPEIYNLQMAGGRSFSMRREPGADVSTLVVRPAPAAPEQMLVDPAAIVGAEHSAIDWYRPSRDGRLVAYGISEGGSEKSTLHILDVDSGEQLPDTIANVHFPFVSWLDDGRSFVYHRYREVPASTPPAERRLDSGSYLHHLGADSSQDRLVLARGANQHVEMTELDRPFIIAPPNSPWMVAVLSHSALMIGEWSDCTFYIAPQTGLADPASCLWTRVATVDDGVRNFALHGDTLYLVTRRSAPRYQVLGLTLPNVDLDQAQVVVPETEAVIEDICVAGDYLLTRDMKGGVGQMRRISLAGGEPEEVTLPINGTILEWANEPAGEDIVLYLTSWTISPRIYRYHHTLQALEDTGWIPPSSVDFSAIVSTEVEAPASDGTLIPLSIIHRRDLQRDGANPTVLMGYGSYGLSLPAMFMPDMLAWYERGGVFAIAHLRGGGEHGREWHEAGRRLNKERTISDFIDCAAYLIAQNYTSPARLAGQGGSAGGIPTGGALVRRPDLWAAMIMQVPVTNALRLELSENGPINVPEFGTVTTEEGFRSLQIIDSYQRVQNGVDYPAVMLTAGLNDPRIPVWQPMKMAARLQAATSSGRPVLLRIEEHGGHGMGSTRQQEAAELADVLAFCLDQFGVQPG